MSQYHTQAQATSAFQLRLGTGFYTIALGLMIFAASDPIYPLLMKGPSEWVLTVPGLDGMRRNVWALIYLVMLGLMLGMHRWIAGAFANQHFLFLALAYFTFSSLWSENTTESIIGSVQNAFTVLFGVIAGTRLGTSGVVRSIFIATMLAAVFTILFVVFLPSHAFGYRYNVDSLRGIYVEKNHLANFLSFGVCSAAYLTFASRSGYAFVFYAISTLILTVLVILAKSSIALILLGFVFGGLAFMVATRHLATRGILALLVSASALMFLAIFLPIMLEALGEDMTLNGRTTLWKSLFYHISQEPVFGHGYRGFWKSSEADAMRVMLGWPAGGAHNAWIQALIYGGAIGLIIWVAQWWGVVARAGRIIATDNNIMAIAAAMITFMAVIWSLFETNQFAHFTHHAIITGLVFAMRSPHYE